MISIKKHIQQLAAILRAKDITDVVISPGSRNGPIIHTLAGCGYFHCRNIVDERSAGYFAIGLSQALQKPVVLVCSSGTAALNYAPAVAEAFYLKVPLIVLTADRPEYWIDQAESQCIRQSKIYQDFTKKEVTLPLGESEKDLWYAGRLLNECLNLAQNENPGPVHVNIPLEEPLHEISEDELPDVKIIAFAEKQHFVSDETLRDMSMIFNRSSRILVLAGQGFPNPGLENCLAALVERCGVVVFKEHLANLDEPSFCTNIDTLMASILEDNPTKFAPELLITFGGQLVSKSIKQFLRKNRVLSHWHISSCGDYFDTYQSLTKVVKIDAADFFEQILEVAEPKDSEYPNIWKAREIQVNALRDSFIQNTEYSDLIAFNIISKYVPENSVLHLGNSTPVRYALICNKVQNTLYLGNRGTAGIDGSLSTAVGFASVSNKINTVIVGDLSFFYDSNALWNKYIGDNLRIIVMNNRGGNIFGLIKGPSDSPAYQEHFFTENQMEAKSLATAYSLNYFRAENEDELDNILVAFYSQDIENAAILEIFTDAEVNTKVFRALFRAIKCE